MLNLFKFVNILYKVRAPYRRTISSESAVYNLTLAVTELIWLKVAIPYNTKNFVCFIKNIIMMTVPLQITANNNTQIFNERTQNSLPN